MLRVNTLFHRILKFVRRTAVFILALGFAPPSGNAQIDLHAHLHMKPGLGIFLQGEFNEAPRSTQWSQKIFTRATGVSLSEMTSETRPKLIVFSLYGHPYFGYSYARDGFHFDRRENVRRSVEQEYQEFKSFVDSHSDHFAIAKNAHEARHILKQGKTVIVISLEGAWATLESPEDFHRWIDERGLSIVTPVHLTPDTLGGNALMNIVVSFANSTFDFITSVWKSGGECLRHFCKSTEGFTEEGTRLVDELMKRQVWIDLAHANEKEVEAVIAKYEVGAPSQKNPALPLLVTHTQMREFFPAERGLGQLEINYIRKQDGIVGMLPSQYMFPEAMKNAEDEVRAQHPEEAKAPSAAGGLTCISGLDIYKKTIAYAIASLGKPESVAMASDINAPLDGLSPGCGQPQLDEAQLDLHRRGYTAYSQWNALAKYVAADPKWADQTLEHFLLLWEKVRP